MNISKNLIAFFALMFFFSGGVFAQKQSRFRQGSEVRDGKTTTPEAYKKNYNIVEEKGQKVLYKKRNVVEFDASTIEGEIRNPSDFYFVHRPEEKFGSLLQKRTNFHKEMLRDVVMIR